MIYRFICKKQNNLSWPYCYDCLLSFRDLSCSVVVILLPRTQRRSALLLYLCVCQSGRDHSSTCQKYVALDPISLSFFLYSYRRFFFSLFLDRITFFVCAFPNQDIVSAFIHGPGHTWEKNRNNREARKALHVTVHKGLNFLLGPSVYDKIREV